MTTRFRIVNAMDRVANAVSQNEGSKKMRLDDVRVRVSLLSGDASNVSSSGAGTGW